MLLLCRFLPQVFFSRKNPLLNWELPFFQRFWYAYAAYAPFCTIFTVPGEKRSTRNRLATDATARNARNRFRCRPSCAGDVVCGSPALTCVWLARSDVTCVLHLGFAGFMIAPFISVLFGIHPLIITYEFVLSSTIYFTIQFMIQVGYQLGSVTFGYVHPHGQTWAHRTWVHGWLWQMHVGMGMMLGGC